MSDSPDSPQVPAPEPKDSAEVVRCLEAAREMWELAQLKEAVRWVQRGAEAAEQDGNDVRALRLARLGADLAAHANSLAEKQADEDSVDVTIDTDEPAETSAVAPSPAPESVAVPEPTPAPAAQPTLSSEANDKAASLTPVPPAVERSAPRVSEKPAAARSFPAPSRPPAAERPSLKPAAAATASKPPGASAPQKTAHTSANVVAASSTATLAELIASGKAERVTVKRSALDANVLVARSSTPNKAVHGARQAVLIFVEEEAS